MPGCVSAGETEEEARLGIAEAIRLYLSPADIEEREGYRVTTVLRTILDVAASGVSQEQLDKAVKDAIRRGLVRRTVLADAARKSSARERMELALRKIRGR